ncbi:MAG TPA: 16S rRNA (cytosine(1402)-N(4))-methyltransferase RsmH [Acidimicrobiales bacterium]|nr:16S rRNA (cytosine(1402)-N(4))-methyltransferase RsmH [Acidimicrobiales bacterium]
MTTTNPSFEHRPVMVTEIVELLGPAPAGVVLDATVGGGGHAAAVLEAHPHLSVVGLDQDADAVEAARARLAPFGDRVSVHHTRFDRLTDTVRALDLPSLSGALFDLGVSSPQLDRADRGFAHRHDAPLDMRMDRSATRTAADVVNGYDEAELVRVLRQHGDERFATRIARAIVAARPVETTRELAALVRDAIPAPARRTGGHPAARSFQAIRIEVNDELAVLPVALDAAIDLLAPGGRVAVLSYHSGEDRIAKARLRLAETGGCACPPQLPCGCGAVPLLRLLGRGGRTPSPEESAANPRAASARLRAAEKLAQPAPHTPDHDTRGADR